MVSLLPHLKSLNLKKTPSSLYFKTRRALRNLNSKQIASEDAVAHAVYNWLCEVVEVEGTEGIEDSKYEFRHESRDSKYGSETPLVKDEEPSKVSSFNEYLQPTLGREQSEESPEKQLLARDESAMSPGGPRTWETLSKHFTFIFVFRSQNSY